MANCPYCPHVVSVGPCVRDGEACNHELTCVEHGRVGVLSVNTVLIACPYAEAMPLFKEESA